MVRNLLPRFARFDKSSAPKSVHDDAGNVIVSFVPGTDLMADRNRQVFITRIASLVSLPQQHFQKLYVATMEAFANFVQQLPASEVHHHAGLGGLLNHSLEVAEKALALRRGFLLPPDSDPSIVSRQADLWSYAVFSAALCHDIGKAVVDQTVHCFDSRRRSIGVWNAWRGAMTNTAYYRVTFVRNRRYGQHELVGPFIARIVIPDAALDWLGSNRDVVSAWIACLSGTAEFAGPLSTIVRQADSLSTSENLGAGESRLPSATQVPLHEKLVVALRSLLDNGKLTLNRPGAVGFVTNTDVWLVSKRCLDLVRTELVEQGHGGVPSRNDRLMDELQQFGICVPNGERAIWRARIKLADFDHELTLLRIPVATLWPDPASRPTSIEGSVEIAGAAPSDEKQAPTSDQVNVDTPDFVLPPIIEPEAVEELDQATPVPDVNAKHSEVKLTDEQPHTEDKEPDGFLQWLREGIQAGTFDVNSTDAFLHVVNEGLLLVSPRIFKKYIGAGGNWHHVQNRFFRARMHRRNVDRTNIIRYKVEGKRRSSVIKGVLIPDPHRSLGVELAEPNKHLELDSRL